MATQFEALVPSPRLGRAREVLGPRKHGSRMQVGYDRVLDSAQPDLRLLRVRLRWLFVASA